MKLRVLSSAEPRFRFSAISDTNRAASTFMTRWVGE
jgi:hypothetical protein